MSLGNVFIRSVVREVGRNYGKAISNAALGNKHSTPVRVVEDRPQHLGASSGGRNYSNQLHKICDTWTIKGPTATFNVAQNMYKSFFDLVEEANADGRIDLKETHDLMKNFVMMRKEMNKVRDALLQLDKPNLEEKVNEMDDNLLEFWYSLAENMEIPEIGPEPTGWFIERKKRLWREAKARRQIHIDLKENILSWKQTLSE